jgi:hypothetical protein
MRDLWWIKWHWDRSPPSQVLWFSPVSFIPLVLHYLEKQKKKLIIFITGLHNKPHSCGASVASAAGPFTIKNLKDTVIRRMEHCLSTIWKPWFT